MKNFLILLVALAILLPQGYGFAATTSACCAKSECSCVSGACCVKGDCKCAGGGTCCTDGVCNCGTSGACKNCKCK